MYIRLNIEELVLDGFPPGDRDQIAAGVQAELGRLLAERGVPPGLADGAALPTLDAGSFTVAPGARPDQIGTQVGQSLYRGLTWRTAR